MDKQRGNDDEEDGVSVAGWNNTEAVELFWRRTLEGRRKKPLMDIVSFNQTGTQIPLYLFPSVALGPTDFLELGKFFDAEQPWHILIPPIKECKEGPEGLIKAIALHFSDRVDEIQPRGRPIVVGGWSAGVTPALELARQLRARGRDVPLLIAIDMAPENTGIAEGRKPMGKQIKSVIRDSRQQGKNRPETAMDLAGVILNRAANKMLFRKLDIIPLLQDYPRLLPEDIVQIRRFYAAALACSRPKSYDGKVLVIEASYDLHLRVKAKWESFANDVEAVVIEGTHPSIVRWKDAAKLGEVLNHRLSELFYSYRDSQPLKVL
jgi:thioesterase domain-containing protein